MYAFFSLAHNRNQINRRYFKHPLVSVAPLLSECISSNETDGLYISEPPDIRSNQVTYYLVRDETPTFDRGTIHRLPPLEVDFSSSSSNLSEVFPTPHSKVPKPVNLLSATLPSRIPWKEEGDLPLSLDRESHNSTNGLEGMDGVVIGAATCLLASRKNPKSPPGMLNADQATLAKAKSIADEAIKVGNLKSIRCRMIQRRLIHPHMQICTFK